MLDIEVTVLRKDGVVVLNERVCRFCAECKHGVETSLQPVEQNTIRQLGTEAHRHFVGMDWEWVRREAKVRDLQNRLGFTIALARKVAEEKQQPEVAAQLARQEEVLSGSLLVKEDTFSRENMTQVERAWLLTNRSPEARAWHVLSDLVTAHLAHD